MRDCPSVPLKTVIFLSVLKTIPTSAPNLKNTRDVHREIISKNLKNKIWHTMVF